MKYEIIVNKYGLLWYKNYKFHRLVGPAEEFYIGSKAWFKDGHMHRLDGPAIEYASGGKKWYIDNIEYTEKEFKRIQTGKK